MIRKHGWTVSLLAVLLAFVLCLTAACSKEESKKEAKPAEEAKAAEDAAPAAGYDDRLDAAFAARKAVFVKAEPQIPDPATCEIVLPADEVMAAYGFERAAAEEMARGLLAEKKWKVVSYSPDGSTAVIGLPVGEGCVYAAVKGNRVTVLYPADQRGKAELKQYIEKDYIWLLSTIRNGITLNVLDQFGLIWSPDGRYFCPMSRYAASMKANTAGASSNVARKTNDSLDTEAYQDRVIDVFYITDTQTGEMFALDSFLDLGSDRHGIWLDGCFSADSKSFYVLYYGKRFSDKKQRETKLLRYNLDTGEEEVCGTEMPTVQYGDETISAALRPMVIQLKDGRFFGLTKRVGPVNSKLVRFGGDVPMEEADMTAWEELDGGYGYFVWGSEKSGNALVYMVVEKGAITTLYTGLIPVRAEEDLNTGLDGMWVVPYRTKQLERMTIDQIDAFYKAREDIRTIPEEEDRYYGIRDIQMSPDGRYALALLQGNEFELMLIRLEDMAGIPVEGIEIGSYDDINGLLRNYDNIMSWSEAGILITNGDGALYQLQ